MFTRKNGADKFLTKVNNRKKCAAQKNDPFL